jgi:glycosyltransferase involved in cell wall biosynthesis
MNSPLTIVIPTAGNRPDLLRRALASLARSELPAAYSETLVVENGRRQGVEKIASEASASLNVRYMFVEQANKSAALNAALKSLADHFIVFLDDDVRLAPNTISAYAAASAFHGIGHFFGGPIRCDYADPPPPAWLLQQSPCSHQKWSPPNPAAVNDVFFLGFNWGAFASDIVAAGGFDPDRGPGATTGATGQETAMQQRLREIEVKAVYLPDALVWHYVPSGEVNWRWIAWRAYRDGIGHMLDRSNRENYFLTHPKYMWMCLLRALQDTAFGVATCSRSRLCASWLHYQRWRGARDALRINGVH